MRTTSRAKSPNGAAVRGRRAPWRRRSAVGATSRVQKRWSKKGWTRWATSRSTRSTRCSVSAERAYTKAKQGGDEVATSQSLILRAVIYRERDDPTRAEAMLSEVEPMFRRNLPAGHLAFASLMLQRALIARARGDLRTALEGANKVLTMTQAGIKAGGQGADFLPTILVRRSDLYLQLQRAGEASADAATALGMLQRAAQPGTFSATLGRAYLTLGRALQVQGRRGEARAAGASAVEHLRSALGPDHPDTQRARQLQALDP